MPRRLSTDRILSALCALPDAPLELALELRALILGEEPGLDEELAFGALAYTVPGRPYGRIGGNVCLIQVRGDALQLAFLHGASLPDPEGLLQGAGKAKRHVELRSSRDLRRPALRALLRAAIEHDPSAS